LIVGGAKQLQVLKLIPAATRKGDPMVDLKQVPPRTARSRFSGAKLTAMIGPVPNRSSCGCRNEPTPVRCR